jgi:hypothetical protein
MGKKKSVNLNRLRDLMYGEHEPKIRELQEQLKEQREATYRSRRWALINLEQAEAYKPHAERWLKDIVGKGKEGGKEATERKQRLTDLFQRWADVLWRKNYHLSKPDVGEKINGAIAQSNWKGIQLTQDEKNFLRDNPRAANTIRQYIIKPPRKSRA